MMMPDCEEQLPTGPFRLGTGNADIFVAGRCLVLPSGLSTYQRREEHASFVFHVPNASNPGDRLDFDALMALVQAGVI